MRYAKIKNNIVDNIIEADAIWVSSQSDIYLPSDIADIGWILKDGELTPPVIDPYNEAEKYIESFFSTAKLLQLKVWYDSIPHELTPKLISVAQWQTEITRQANAGQITFTDVPQYNFDEVANECLSVTANAN